MKIWIGLAGIYDSKMIERLIYIVIIRILVYNDNKTLILLVF
jgi:hypothetical protein